MVHFNKKKKKKKPQNPELVDLKFVTYAQPIHQSFHLLRCFLPERMNLTLEISSQLRKHLHMK